jgi:hypothetical protein
VDMTHLTPEQLEELERLAGNATPYRWVYHDGGHGGHTEIRTYIDDKSSMFVNTLDRRNGPFIAAASPSTVLALVAEVRHLRTCLDGTSHEAAQVKEWMAQLREENASLREECKRLKGVVADLEWRFEELANTSKEQD